MQTINAKILNAMWMRPVVQPDQLLAETSTPLRDHACPLSARVGSSAPILVDASDA